jgi:Ca-activated chloride channel family protein
MFRFANIEMLWLLITIPAFVLAYILYTKRKQRQLTDFGDPELIQQLMPDASKSRTIWKFALSMAALVLLIVAAARPQ